MAFSVRFRGDCMKTPATVFPLKVGGGALALKAQLVQRRDEGRHAH